MKQAILFDLDGTMWDAIEQIKDAYNLAMIEEKIDTKYTYQTLKSIMGLTPEESCPILFPNEDLEKGIDLFKKCFKQELIHLEKHPGTLYPNVVETLKELKEKYFIAVVSNADKGYIEVFLKGNRLEGLFDDYIQAGDTGLAKWENILYMKNKHQLDDIIYVGDTYKDMLESNKANVKFIHASYGFGNIENPSYSISEFKELVPLVDSIFNM